MTLKVSAWHDGELLMQRAAGIEDSPSLRRGVRDHLPPHFMQFVAVQRMAVLATVDEDGRVWASFANGAPGYLRAVDATTLELAGSAVEDSGVFERVRVRPTIGLLAIEPETRRRIRVNGAPTVLANGNLKIEVREVFGNCQQYVQKRALDRVGTPIGPGDAASTASSLSARQKEWIAQADTFFIASYHPEAGADASHRGGAPGFVRVTSPTSLRFPDYSGNNMFQTLGNLTINPRAGLLFLNFETGDTLQITGTARIEAEPQADDVPGALRVVEYTIQHVIERTRGSRLRGVLVEYSPFNPR